MFNIRKRFEKKKKKYFTDTLCLNCHRLKRESLFRSKSPEVLGGPLVLGPTVTGKRPTESSS